MEKSNIPMTNDEFIRSAEKYYHATLKYIEKHETTELLETSKQCLGVAMSFLQDDTDKVGTDKDEAFFTQYFIEEATGVKAEKNILVLLTKELIGLRTYEHGQMAEIIIIQTINLLVTLKHLSYDRDRQKRLWFLKQIKQKTLGKTIDKIVLKLLFAYHKNNKGQSVRDLSALSISDIKKLNTLLW